MKISELYKNKNVVISVELFPPKKEVDFKNIDKILSRLKELKVDYISVTHGALSSLRDNKTVEIAKKIKNIGIEPLAHLTSIGLEKEKLIEIKKDLKQSGIENVLVLRGDLPKNHQVSEYHYASDLVAELNDDFCLAGACYPEKHPEAQSLRDDIEMLQKKVELGLDFLITQLFYDNEDFYYFRQKCREKNIHIPISVGIMPVLNTRQIERITGLCGAKVPVKLRKMMEKFGDNKAALEDAAVAYTTGQIIDLIANGVDGIHLYIMNKPRIYEKIINNIKYILEGLNNE